MNSGVVGKRESGGRQPTSELKSTRATSHLHRSDARAECSCKSTESSNAHFLGGPQPYHLVCRPDRPFANVNKLDQKATAQAHVPDSKLFASHFSCAFLVVVAASLAGFIVYLFLPFVESAFHHKPKISHHSTASYVYSHQSSQMQRPTTTT